MWARSSWLRGTLLRTFVFVMLYSMRHIVQQFKLHNVPQS